MNPKKAFTLLEILLVVAAIAILAGIVVLAINPSRQLAKARNAQRSMDVNTIQKAVYEYSIDHNSLSGVVSTTPLEICRSGASTCSGLIDLSFLTNGSTYLTSLPVDPQVASLNGTGYVIYLLPSGRPVVSSSLTELGQEISVIEKPFVCGDTLNFNSLVYGTVVGPDNRCWFDRNLGATTTANNVSGYGSYYQWGRAADGHQNYSVSDKTTVQSLVDNPGHNDFIYGMISPYDWRNPQSPNIASLWAGVNGGVNNPCPVGWHVPTTLEWSSLINSVPKITNTATAYSSVLKLTTNGHRYYNNALLYNQGSSGYYWSGGTSGNSSLGLYLDVSGANSARVNFRAYGFAVRCLQN
ncbi:MAG: FISUMP domain-containing protein [Candidatus Falkowbacteria bacterium]